MTSANGLSNKEKVRRVNQENILVTGLKIAKITYENICTFYFFVSTMEILLGCLFYIPVLQGQSNCIANGEGGGEGRQVA